jgi:flagellar basal-body rod protein FlgF
MSGARQALEEQSVISNNLANVSTSGFRAQMLSMRSVEVQGDGALATRASVALSTPGADFATGPVQYTGRSLDVALMGDAWLAVVGTDGQEAYTRRGDLQIDSDGILTSGGFAVMGEGGPVQVPLGAQLFIADDGTLSALGEGENPESIAQFGRLKLVDTKDVSLVRTEEGLFRQAPQDGADSMAIPAAENARLSAGSLEGSNVSAVGSMVDMIANARMYEMQMKVIKSTEENDQRANTLLSVQN